MRTYKVAAFTTVSTSEASLSYCVNELRKGKTPKEVSVLVKEKFDGRELELAIDYLRMQHRISKNAKPKKP